MGLAACVLNAIACSGDGGATDEGAGGNTAAAGAGSGNAGQGTSGQGGSSGTGNAQGGDGVGGTGGEGTGPAVREAGGRIQIISFVFNNADYVTADFWRAETVEIDPDPDPIQPQCTFSSDGHCSLQLCPASGTTGGAVAPAEPVAAPSAGVIDLTATDPTDPSVLIQATLTPDTQGRYANAQLNKSFTGLENITLAAQGGDVPAFTHTLDYPLLLLLTNPALTLLDTGHKTLDVSRSQDTVLTWDRGQAGLTLVVQGNTSGGQLNCSFPSEAGAGTLPSSLISQYPGEDLIFTSVTASSVQAGDYEVSVLTAGDVVTPERDAGIKGVLVP